MNKTQLKDAQATLSLQDTGIIEQWHKEELQYLLAMQGKEEPEELKLKMDYVKMLKKLDSTTLSDYYFSDSSHADKQ